MTRVSIGAVLIGRNEGEHLRACLSSVLPQVSQTIYVDSGSTDGSVALAKEMGSDTVELSAEVPFTAARARNAGWRRLVERGSDIQCIQFVDSDCVLNEGWIAHAAAEFAAHPEAAIVTGHVREAAPNRNIYHRLAAMEWDTPIGVAQYCGGIALVRLAALEQVNGYRDDLRAGEEPELCVRLRQAGWTILKLDQEMAVHDIDTTSFRQWWRRTVRSGHAYAEGASLHGASPARHWVRESQSIWLWGLVLPLVAIALAWPTYGISVILGIALYGALFAKILIGRTRKRRESISSGALYAGMCVLAKWPQAVGQLSYWMNRVRRNRSTKAECPSATSNDAFDAGQSQQLRH